MNFTDITLKFIPFFLISIVIEVLLIALWKKEKYSQRESLISLAILIGNRISKLIPIIPAAALMEFAWNHRISTISLDNWWNLLLLFITLEFVYYWYHRASHRIRWFWATHVVHHSPEYFNFSAAYRLGWTGAISGAGIFFAPLVWLGFQPSSVITALALNLVYQFWIHTELIPKLGILEWFLNTPSHHRVHHGSNGAYIDRNYGGVLIIFDRLFGTFAAEEASNPPVYGLTHPIKSNNPFKVVFNEWIEIYKDLTSTNSFKERFCYLFAPPEWKFTKKGSPDEQLVFPTNTLR
ncbi:sterol desaturase [Rivularia sp. PCC 7116]|uniref:sterol desaturase family protein n=1 Tax=Rivularia sp. PCC 7116 TaxID=373994 RepID=UPI00029EE6CC|nr:sterol desaturase family protein [Rivularia sp. PCC 7116]AFY55406.1 sterol desaturase [Rivularia sp. PCC 7116]